jgi:hypothetical protein
MTPGELLGKSGPTIGVALQDTNSGVAELLARVPAPPAAG